MTKKRSRFLFALFTIILVVLLVATFVNFTYPFSINGRYYTYSSFVSNIKLGEDISDSYRFVYRAELPDSNTASSNYDELKQSTMNSLADIVSSEGYRDVTVSQYSQGEEDYIVVTVGNILTIDDENSIKNLIGNPATISFSMSENIEDSFAGAQDVANVGSGSQYDSSTGETYNYISIEFKDANKIAEATEGGGTLYIFLGDSLAFGNGITIDSAITNGYIAINLGSSENADGSTYNPTLEDAKTYANQIRVGLLPLSLTQVDGASITASYGVGSDLLLYIAIIIFVIATFVYLIVKYKEMGLVACFNLLFFITLSMFLLQSIPYVHINFAGIIGILLAYIVTVESLISILEKAKAHYLNDNKLYIAFRLAQKESLARTFMINLLFVVAGFICLFMPSMGIQSFGWAIFVLPFVGVLCSLAIMRLFIKMYLAFNNTDAKKLNFHKGGKNA